MQKKVMLLGGNYFQMTATKAAKELGHYVISVDYLPDNPAHKFADEYHNVSTVDREAVLQLAKELKIDGIVSYASDVSAPTAAYVAEQMGLPTNPLEAVEVLTRKDRFRPFLEENGFPAPQGQGFTDYQVALEFFKTIRKPAMVKPVDASGSKGVSKIFSEDEFESAYKNAAEYSRAGVILVEEFMERKGHQIAGDGFIVDGKLVFAGFMNEHFDQLCNPLVPIGESYPAVLSEELREKARTEIQKVLTALDMKMGAINLDFIVGTDDEIHILEIGPRNGGNLITDAIAYASDLDLAKFTIQAALGLDCSAVKEMPIHTYTSSYVVHALESGIFDHVEIADEIKDDLVRYDLFVEPGDEVSRFDNGALGIGAAIIKHATPEIMMERMEHMERYIRVVVR